MPYADPERKREYDRQRREREGDKLRAQALAYYYEHREQRLAQIKARVDPALKAEYDRAYNEREDVKRRNAEQRKRWADANPDKVRQQSRRANHRRRQAKPTPEAVDYMAILDGDPCSYCGSPMQHIDHIDAISKGGDGNWTNLTAACQPCNYRKGDKRLLAFLAA